MTDKTIPELSSAATITGAEQLELAQSGNSVNATLATLLAWKTPNPVAVTSTYNANNYDLIIADTSGGPFTITLPASTAFGQIIWFIDATGTWNTNNLTISGNGANILGSVDVLVANTARDNFSLIYYNSPQGWTIGH